MSSDTSSTTDAGRDATLGRRIFGSLYFVGLVYIIVVGFASVLPKVFWPEPSATASTTSTTSAPCDVASQQLYDELMAFSGERVQSIGGTAAARKTFASFFSDWDNRFLLLQERCDGVPHTDMAQLRYRMETMLRRFDREEGHVARRVRSELSNH